MKRLLVRLGFSALKKILSRKINDLKLLLIAEKTVDCVSDLGEIFTDDEKDNSSQVKDWAKTNATKLTEIGTKAIELVVEENLPEKVRPVIMNYVSLTPEIVGIYTDNDIENGDQLRELLANKAPQVIKTTTDFIVPFVEEKIPEEAKDLVTMLASTLQNVVEVYTDDNPEDREQLLQLLEDQGPDLIEGLAKIWI